MIRCTACSNRFGYSGGEFTSPAAEWLNEGLLTTTWTIFGRFRVQVGRAWVPPVSNWILWGRGRADMGKPCLPALLQVDIAGPIVEIYELYHESYHRVCVECIRSIILRGVLSLSSQWDALRRIAALQ
eukprot:693486-Prorocentrum_minimum.AAC.1